MDRSNNLSITNIALIILLIKLALMPTLALPDVAAFFIVLLNYGHKRMEANKAAKEEAKLTSQLSVSMDEKVKEVTAELEKIKEIQAVVTKQAEETKKFISTSNLTNAFVPRNKRD